MAYTIYLCVNGVVPHSIDILGFINCWCLYLDMCSIYNPNNVGKASNIKKVRFLLSDMPYSCGQTNVMPYNFRQCQGIDYCSNRQGDCWLTYGMDVTVIKLYA
ncbi:hypothetical protein DPMN_090854 [Dreissena polymorpha]|uniref:Uncharacterized protein n=1 Tax=Dreissena polymorpha TaxID=45954 RepID=A0A9D4L0J4_DREPO|nr:hypothetical protein DPMN_090854 [Dreissena polymorpha]